ncbi:hypothetical protein L8N14_015195, partial [Serratia marcescens]|nr:hypothetical protein [Serratia marcescens]
VPDHIPVSMIRDAIVSSADHTSSFLPEEIRRMHARAMIGGFLRHLVSVDVLPSVDQFAREANSLTAAIENLSSSASVWVDHARQIESFLVTLHTLPVGDIAGSSGSGGMSPTVIKKKIEDLTLEIKATTSRVEIARSAYDASSADARALFTQMQDMLKTNLDDSVLLQRELCKRENLLCARMRLEKQADDQANARLLQERQSSKRNCQSLIRHLLGSLDNLS